MEPLSNEQRLIEAGWTEDKNRPSAPWEHPKHGRATLAEAIHHLPILPLLAEIERWRDEASWMATKLQEAQTVSDEKKKLSAELLDTMNNLARLKAEHEILRELFENQNAKLLQAYNLLYRKGQIETQIERPDQEKPYFDPLIETESIQPVRQIDVLEKLQKRLEEHDRIAAHDGTNITGLMERVEKLETIISDNAKDWNRHIDTIHPSIIQEIGRADERVNEIETAISLQWSELQKRIETLESDMCEAHPGGGVAARLRTVPDTPAATSEPESQDSEL